jgi:hypothetical protein
MGWPRLLRQDKTWTVVSAVSGAVAALAAFGAIYQTRQIAYEDRLAKKPYLKLKTAQIRADQNRHTIVFMFDNTGARPAIGLRERLVIVKPDLPTPIADLKSSTANEIAPNAEYVWQHAKIDVPANVGLHYFLFTLSYGDPVVSTRQTQVFVLKWPGATQGRVPVDLEHASTEEAERLLKQIEAQIGPLGRNEADTGRPPKEGRSARAVPHNEPPAPDGPLRCPRVIRRVMQG